MTHALLTAYRAVEALSGQMLHAAQRADWAAFDQAQNACARQIDQLRQRAAGHAAHSGWSPGHAAQKQAILLRILRIDAQIRRLRGGESLRGGDSLRGGYPLPGGESNASPARNAGSPVFSAFPMAGNSSLLH